MTFAQTTTSDGTLELTITVPWADVSKTFDHVKAEIAQKTEVPGFGRSLRIFDIWQALPVSAARPIDVRKTWPPFEASISSIKKKRYLCIL